MSALEQLVMEYGTVQIQYVPQNDDMPWTVTLMRSRWLEPGTGHPTERSEWWDHEHAASVEEAAAHLLRQLPADSAAAAETTERR